MANVFISHRGDDTAEAERLATDIRAAGHEVRLDEWELSVGDSIIAWMNEATESAGVLVLCLSSAGVLAPWISREWMSALARQLNGESVKLLPVKLTGGDPPALLADIKFADLTTDWARGVAELLRAIR